MWFIPGNHFKRITAWKKVHGKWFDCLHAFQYQSVTQTPCTYLFFRNFNGIYLLAASDGWSAWSDWSVCNSYGERNRRRTCLRATPDYDECQGDEHEVQPCEVLRLNGKYLVIFHTIWSIYTSITIPGQLSVANTSTYLLLLIIVLLSGSNILFYIRLRKRCSIARNVKNIGSPCFDSYPNQYSSLPTKEDQPRVKRKACLGGLNGTNIKILSNANGSSTKPNNEKNLNTPKVLSKCSIECDTGTIKRNSYGLNNSRTVCSIDEDKF